MKEVICIDDRISRIIDELGNPMPPAKNNPVKDEIYFVDEALVQFGKTYYHIPGLDDEETCWWDAKLFADISKLQDEIEESLEKPAMEIYIRKAQEELQPSQHRRKPDYIFDPLKYGNWLHIMEEYTPHP